MMTASNGYEIINSKIDCKFPLWIFPDHIQNIIKQLNKKFGFEIPVIASGMLFAYSTALGNSKFARVNKVWKDSGNLWIAIVGERGTGKSPMIGFCIKPLNAEEEQYHNQWQGDLMEWEGLSKKEKQIVARPLRKQKFTNDVTTEGLIKIMSFNHNGMGMLKDELKGFFTGMNQYKGGKGEDKQFYLSAFNKSTYIKNRANDDPIMIKEMFLSIIGSIQPSILSGVSFDNTDDGMIDRWLYVRASDHIPKFVIDDISDNSEAEYMSFILQAISYSETKTEMYWDAGSKEMFAKAVNEIRKFKDLPDTRKALKTYASKMETYLLRFIIIISSMQDENTITSDVVNKAFDVIVYFLQTAKSIFSEFDNHETVMAIFKGDKAATKKQKIQALINANIEMNNTEIAEHVGVSKQYVGKVYREFTG